MQAIADVVRELENLLEGIPGTEKIREELKEMRRLILEQRPPRFALVGRRGSGKSSLINAIFGEHVAEVGHTKAQTGRGQWWEYEGDLGSLEILDTRGLQEGTRPEQADTAASPLESILSAIKEKEPDAILFLVKAKEVDSAIQGDLEALEQLRDALKGPMPIVGVITHIDELEPKNVKLHLPDQEDVEDIQEKANRVKEVQAHLERTLKARPKLRDDVVTVIGVSAYMSWRRDGSMRDDERWKIDRLLDYLVSELPDEAQVVFARLTQLTRIQKKIATRLTSVVSGLCAAIAATPLPVGDLAPITSLQISLVAGIAYISGREMSLKTAGEFLTAIGLNVGASFALRETARALAKIFAPGVGHVISAAVAGSATYGIGRAASSYFIDGSSIEEAKATYSTAKSEAESDR